MEHGSLFDRELFLVNCLSINACLNHSRRYQILMNLNLQEEKLPLKSSKKSSLVNKEGILRMKLKFSNVRLSLVS